MSRGGQMECLSLGPLSDKENYGSFIAKARQLGGKLFAPFSERFSIILPRQCWFHPLWEPDHSQLAFLGITWPGEPLDQRTKEVDVQYCINYLSVDVLLTTSCVSGRC